MTRWIALAAVLAGCPAEGDGAPPARTAPKPTAQPLSTTPAVVSATATASDATPPPSAGAPSARVLGRPPPLPPPAPVSPAVKAKRIALLKGVAPCDTPPVAGGPGAMRPQATGLTREAALAKLGAPHCHRGPDTWVYWYPESCSSERDVVTVEVRGEKVARVTSVSVATGEACDHDF